MAHENLVDDAFVTELSDPDGYGAKTLDFVKKALKGLLYVDLTVAGRTVSGQVKKGDGSNHGAEVDLMVQTAAPAAVSPNPQVEGTITVTGGTSSASGTFAAHVKTTTSGTFSVDIGGSGAVGVVVSVDQGLPSVVVVS